MIGLPTLRPPRRVRRTACHLLANIKAFSDLAISLPLRCYQVRPLNAILDSILHRKGLEFLLIFPRQSGKNEAVAQLLAYCLNLFQRVGGNIVYGATGDGLGLGIERLEQRLDNAWNAGKWTKKNRPARRCLGNAAVVFLSSHPSASTRGQTAHHLLVIDETQDQLASHIESVFTPMRAANNATALYIGTVKLTTDYLWQKKLELEREETRDGIRRVWLVHPEEVTAENRPYHDFLLSQVRRYGRHHPIVASEYYLEPIDGAGGLFDARRQALMRGSHPRRRSPDPDRTYVATLDLAGEDEAATDPIAALARPGRDYTACTIFAVDWPPSDVGGWPAPGPDRGPPPGAYAPGPTYRAEDIFIDHGSKHFQDSPAQPALVQRLIAYLQHWRAAHVLADESGVGQGMISYLRAALGQSRVTGYNFAGRGQKAALGSLFLSLVETGRFRYWADDADLPPSHIGGQPGSDGWWFWQQVAACRYEVPPDGRFDRDLRWEVPPAHRTDTPAGPQPTHDDRLLSAALVAELDRLIRQHALFLGTAESEVINPHDPLADLSF